MEGAGQFSLRVLIPAVAAGPRAAVSVGGEGAQTAVAEKLGEAMYHKGADVLLSACDGARPKAG